MLTRIMMMEATMANMWIKFQSMTRPSKGRRFLESAFEASRMAFQEKGDGVIQYQCSTSWSSMNFAMAPPKKLMNNVGRTMTIVWTMFVTERTWLRGKGFLRFSQFNLKVAPTSDLKLLPSKLLASALCEERWRSQGTCRRQVQTDSVQKYLKIISQRISQNIYLSILS